MLKYILLDIGGHMRSFNHSECFISELLSHAELKFVYYIRFSCLCSTKKFSRDE